MIFWLETVVIAVLCAALVLMLAAYLFGERIAFPAPAPSYADSDKILKLALPDGVKISARFLAAENSDKCILYSHGNREDIFTISETLEKYRDLGYNVLAYDYCGYGTSGGQPTENRARECVLAAYDFLVGQKKFGPENTAVIGFSIGSVPTAYVCSKRKVGAMVIVGGLAKSSYAILPFDFVFWDMLDNLRRVKNVRAPALFIHGSEDRILPLRNGKMLFEACASKNKRLEIFRGFGHNKLPESQIYWDCVSKFLKENLK